MARWDEILSLPVQSPPPLEFSAADIVWSKVEGWRDNLDRLALIPFARVDDFVKGESANKECPTRFHVEARRRRSAQSSYKQKVDGVLEYILYWCSFGPDDHRKGGVVRPSRTTYVPKKKNAGRPNTKRGCTCHFIVKRLIANPAVALIIYNQDKHVDKQGLPCHGPQDKKAEGTRAMFAPYISDDLRLRVLSLLHVGVPVETIMQRHTESVERQGGPCNRDDLLNHRYVRIQERSIRRSTYELDADDAVSISMWVESHQSHVFFFEDFSESEPFTLGIQTEWQLQQMIRFGNRGLVASDSRFGTNKLKYPVHSLLVFNSDNKAIPVAWVITPRFFSGDSYRWMRALYNRVRTKDPTWKLAGFIVDDPSTDAHTIRDVFQCSVLISFWRIRHAWHKNLVKRCMETELRAQMSKRLSEAVNEICRGHGTMDLFDIFMDDFVDSYDFIDYFKAIWYPRIGNWTRALKTLPLASQETCAALEFYHNQLKVRLLNEKDPGVYQRADWLVDKLDTKVHSYFWLDEYSEKDNFARYQKNEWVSGLTSWRKALKIPDADVIMEGKCAKVTDSLDRDRVHVVWNPGSEFAICDCSWAEMGYLCEHVFKVIRLCHDRGQGEQSISLFQYKRALVEMLHCPQYDSLIRDHAVSLAVAVQKQLDAMVDLDGCCSLTAFTQKQAADPQKRHTSEIDFLTQDGELVTDTTQRQAENSTQDGELASDTTQREAANSCKRPRIETDSINQVSKLAGESVNTDATSQYDNSSQDRQDAPGSVAEEAAFRGVDVNPVCNQNGDRSNSAHSNDVLTNQVTCPSDVCSNGTRKSVISDRVDAISSSNKISPNLSKDASSHLTGKCETPGVSSRENGVMDSETNSQTTIENRSSTDNTISLAGVHDTKINKPALDLNTKANSLPSSPSSSQGDEQPSVNVATRDTGSSVVPS